MSKQKMVRPWCKIDGTPYQLEVKNGVWRFPNNWDGRPEPDLNKWVLEYIQGKRPLSDLFEYATNSGNSYEYVWGIYSLRGWNNHIVTQGKEPTKRFILYSPKEIVK